MNHSENINELAAALAKAQGEIGGALKSSDNPFFKSKYADLTSVMDACRAPLSKNGIAIIQIPGGDDQGNISIETMLVHSSGQWISGAIGCKPGKADAQGAGSVITYLRRYALAAMTGVTPEDDDGEGAVGRGKAGGPEMEPRKVAVTSGAAKAKAAVPPSSDWANQAIKTIAGISTLPALAEWWKTNQPHLMALPSDQLNRIVDAKDEKQAVLSNPV